MGCGCSKSKPNRSQRLKTSIRLKSSSKVPRPKSRIISPIILKTKICNSCKHSKQTPKERKRGLKVCHKNNRLIINITRNPNVKCPIKKWK